MQQEEVREYFVGDAVHWVTHDGSRHLALVADVSTTEAVALGPSSSRKKLHLRLLPSGGERFVSMSEVAHVKVSGFIRRVATVTCITAGAC